MRPDPRKLRAWWRALPLAARGWLAAGIAAVILIVAAVLALGGGSAPLQNLVSPPPTSLADPVPYDGRSPVQPPGDEQRVLVQMPRPALGDLKKARTMGAGAQRRYVHSLRKEAATTRSALRARGVALHDVVGYGLVWNGFAATIRTRDLARLNSPGTRVRTVRRLYPATSEPVPVPGKPPPSQATPGQPPVAVLDTGLRIQTVDEERGYDAVDRDRDPTPGGDPSATGRRETSGTALGGLLAAEGERVLPIRIASLRPAPGRAVEAVGGTDELIAGLERAVDPDGDGDTSDHVAVALVGVNAPYAGFSSTPEAQAVKGAAGLGTLVVAPAGNEGAGDSTVGSPASAPAALAVGALAGPEPAPRVPVYDGNDLVAYADVLGGAPNKDPLTAAGPVTSADPAVLGREAPQLRGKAVIVRAGADPSAQAAAAANTGARLVLLVRHARPRAAGDRRRPRRRAGGRADRRRRQGRAGDQAGREHPAAGRDARAALRRPVHAGGVARPAPRGRPRAGCRSRSSPRPGTALTVGLDGQAVVAGGTAVAAARVAAVAAKLARARPDLTPAQLRAVLIGGADPASLPVDRTGAGRLRGAGTVLADPPAPVSGPLDPVAFTLAVASSGTLKLQSTAGSTVEPPSVQVRPGAPAPVAVRLTKAGATGEGRLVARDAHGRRRLRPVARAPARRRAGPARRAAGLAPARELHARRVHARGPADHRDEDPARRQAGAPARRRQGQRPAHADRARRRARPDARRVRLHAPAQRAARAAARPLRVPRARLGAAPAGPDRGHVAHIQAMRTVTLYTRPGCHLCDEARADLERILDEVEFLLEEIDITARRRAARALPGAHPRGGARRRRAFRLLR